MLKKELVIFLFGAVLALNLWGQSPPEAWQSFVPPPDDKFDWVQLTSGEWLKGEFKVLYEYTVEFDSDEMDLQEFPIYDIARLRTRKYQRILIQEMPRSRDTKVVAGKLLIDGDTVSIIRPDETLTYTRRQIVSISDGSKSERDNWSGELSLGMNFRSGNTESVDTTIMANLRRRTPHSRFNIDYIANYSETSKTSTVDNQRLNAYIDWFWNRRFYSRLLAGEYYRDPFTNIDGQYSISTGFGYSIVNTSKTEFDVNAGVGYQETVFDSVDVGEEKDSSSAFGYAGTYYDVELNSRIDFLLDYSFRLLNEESGRYTHHSVTTLSVDLIGDLELDLSLIWDRIEKPQEDAEGNVPEQDDYQMVVGVSYEF